MVVSQLPTRTRGSLLPKTTPRGHISAPHEGHHIELLHVDLLRGLVSHLLKPEHPLAFYGKQQGGWLNGACPAFFCERQRLVV